MQIDDTVVEPSIAVDGPVEQTGVHATHPRESHIPSPASDEPSRVPVVEAVSSSPNLNDGESALVRPTSAREESARESAIQSLRNSPEPSQVDQQGHYVGPASGASFLLRIQRKLRHQSTLSSESSIFTFGDLPLPDFNPSFFVLPSRGEAAELLDRYFNFASATHRYLHQQTVLGWLDELYETNGVMKQRIGARSRTAVLLMLFAQAKNYSKSKPGINNVELR
jgi:hypothetical protein